MQKAIDFLEEQLHGITPLGASSLINSVKVNAYGQKTLLEHLAHTQGDGKRITIQPYDSSLVSAVSKACQNAGFDAYVFSKESVVVNIPEITGDAKEDIRKRIKKLGEETKVAIRNIRKQYKKGIDKDDKVAEKEIQKVTDEAVNLVEELVERKRSYVN